MKLNLKDIIEVPGASLPFECEMESSRLNFPSITGFTSPLRAEGIVKNGAGALSLIGSITAEMTCMCDLCMKEFASTKFQELDIHLAAELEDEENDSIFLLDGNLLDVSEVLETCFILEMESKFLCSEDCAGLCEYCGHRQQRQELYASGKRRF